MSYRSIWSNFGSYGSSSSLSGLLSQYSSIRSGAYGKALKSYYGKTAKAAGASAVQKTASARSSAFTSALTEANKKLETLRNDASSLTSSANNLAGTGKNNVFAKKMQTGADGKLTTGYNVDAIYKAVTAFADDYNHALSSADGSTGLTVQSAVGSMKTTTAAVSRKLESVGISVDSSGRLSVDEEKFRASDMDTVKEIFSGSSAYARLTSSASSRLYSASNSQYAANSSAYNRSGSSYGLYGSSGNAYGLYGSYLLGSRFSSYF